MYGQLLTLEGRFDAAIDEFRRALALDRYSLQARADLAALLVHRGDVAEARQILEAGLAQDADSWLMHQTMADVLAAEGREAESIDADLKAKLLVGDPHDDVESQREAYRLHGRTGLLRRQVELLTARHEGPPADAAMGLSRYGVASSLALAHARLRDADQAMRWLQVAADRGEEGPLYLNLWHYDFLRDDPRFKELHQRVFGRR
jgi:tetratricopeptide (TPR) repeat protein